MDAIVALNGIFSPCELIFNVNAVFELIKSRSMAVAVDNLEMFSEFKEIKQRNEVVKKHKRP